MIYLLLDLSSNFKTSGVQLTLDLLPLIRVICLPYLCEEYTVKKRENILIHMHMIDKTTTPNIQITWPVTNPKSKCYLLIHAIFYISCGSTCSSIIVFCHFCSQYFKANWYIQKSQIFLLIFSYYPHSGYIFYRKDSFNIFQYFIYHFFSSDKWVSQRNGLAT